MPLLTLPLIAWGSADDISAYTTGSGTPTVTSGVTDPFGGTGAYTIDDNDAGGVENKYKAITFGANGTQYVTTFAKAGTASVSHVAIFDNTAAAFRAVLALTWSGGVPSATIASGSGSVVGTVSVGSSWYLVLWSADNIVAANTNRLYLYGATSSSATTGTTSYYVRNCVLLDYLDDAVSFPRPRRGSAWAQAASGTEDAWIVGTDEILRGRVRWVPRVAASTPVVKSGWEGRNEATGVNCGVKALLTAGRAKSALTWVPDRADCTTAQSVYLSAPEDADAVELEGNGQRSMTVEFRSTSPFVGL